MNTLQGVLVVPQNSRVSLLILFQGVSNINTTFTKTISDVRIK